MPAVCPSTRRQAVRWCVVAVFYLVFSLTFTSLSPSDLTNAFAASRATHTSSNQSNTLRRPHAHDRKRLKFQTARSGFRRSGKGRYCCH
ncbi:hypothetical protein PoB_002087500 [Plakobranchus ocellatus]|uniref:Secreted protein n=1 Tax=Plakobranchus ocellatus TaxID=259542 RepID=A0AAV3ZFI4_9GAST|nr:hypothetical protein PoB_002087500 [Plakobranchus ocellatus]